MQSEAINELVTALAKARSAFPLIEKNETATIKGKTQKGQSYEYSYDYASLAEVLDKTAPALSENELVMIETITETESGTELTVMLAHSSGQYKSSSKLLGTFNDPKQFGGAMTYYRRYLAEGLLNIASQQDKDAQGVESETTPKRQPQKQQPAASKTNGKQKQKLNSAQSQIWARINEHTDYFNDYWHAVNALGGQPNFSDQANWDQFVADALDYVKHKKAPPVSDEEMNQDPLFPETETAGGGAFDTEG